MIWPSPVNTLIKLWCLTQGETAASSKAELCTDIPALQTTTRSCKRALVLYSNVYTPNTPNILLGYLCYWLAECTPQAGQDIPRVFLPGDNFYIEWGQSWISVRHGQILRIYACKHLKTDTCIKNQTNSLFWSTWIMNVVYTHYCVRFKRTNKN